MVQELKTSYVVAVAEQLSFVSAFLGGVSATILITIVIFSSPKRATALLVSSSALAACSLLIAVISSWRLTIGLHPDLPFSADQAKLLLLWKVMISSYGVGVFSLIVSVGISGWVRSTKSGLLTSAFALIAIVFFITTSIYIRA